MFIYELDLYCSIESGREGSLGNPVILRNREGRGSMPARVQWAPVVSGWGIKKNKNQPFNRPVTDHLVCSLSPPACSNANRSTLAPCSGSSEQSLLVRGRWTPERTATCLDFRREGSLQSLSWSACGGSVPSDVHVKRELLHYDMTYIGISLWASLILAPLMWMRPELLPVQSCPSIFSSCSSVTLPNLPQCLGLLVLFLFFFFGVCVYREAFTW